MAGRWTICVLLLLAVRADPLAAQPREISRIWLDEPPLVRLARDHFGELTEVDARLFTAVAEGKWADFRDPAETSFQADDPASWDNSPAIGVDRLLWLCTDPAVRKYISVRGVWLRGVRVEGELDLYRGDVPFSITMYDCLITGGMDLRYARIQELDIRNCCLARIKADNLLLEEAFYLCRSVIYGGCRLVDAQIGIDLDATGAAIYANLPEAESDPDDVALNLYDAKISGDLRLSGEFEAHGCVRMQGIRIGRSFDAQDGHFHNPGGNAIEADRSTVGNNVHLRNEFEADGSVQFLRARVEGNFDCDGGKFIAAPNSNALHADGCHVEGEFYLGKGFEARGEVRLVSAVIGGSLDCDNGQFFNPTGDALSIDSSSISGVAHLGYEPSASEDVADGFLAEGGVTMSAARIGRGLDCNAGRFHNPGGYAIVARSMQVKGDVSLHDGFDARGTVFLGDVEIDGTLNCSAGHFTAPESAALFASQATIEGSVLLTEGFAAEGTVHFESAHVSGHFDCRGSRFDGRRAPAQSALVAHGLKIGGHAFFNRVENEDQTLDVMMWGHVGLRFVDIAMNWDCQGARFEHPEGDALDASDAEIRGHVILTGVLIDGRATFSRSQIRGMLIWQDIVQPDRVELDLRFANIWVIKDQRLDDWPDRGRLQIEGLVYNHFDDDSPLGVEDRLAWILRQIPPPDQPAPMPPAPPAEILPVAYAHSAEPPTATDHPTATSRMYVRRYATQPYTQLAAVYRAIGQDENANRVLVARAEQIGALAAPFSPRGFWFRYLGRLIGYGYEPFRAVKIGLAIVIAGALVFALGDRRNLMTETKLAEHVFSRSPELPRVSPGYHAFNPLVYSLDVFLPFIDLKQVCYWLPGVSAIRPEASRNCLLHVGSWSLRWTTMLRGYLWFQTLAGWTLTTLLAAAVTGIVKS